MGISAWKEVRTGSAGRCAAIRRAATCTRPKPMYFPAMSPGLEDGLHRYLSRDHVLEQRCRVVRNPESGIRAALDRSVLSALAGGLEIWRTRLPLLSARHRPCARGHALCGRRTRMEREGRRHRDSREARETNGARPGRRFCEGRTGRCRTPDSDRSLPLREFRPGQRDARALASRSGNGRARANLLDPARSIAGR